MARNLITGEEIGASKGPRNLITGEPIEPKPDSGQLAFLNRGIALTLGAPVDIANFALSLVGLDSEMPVGGSRSIERGMGGVGVQVPQEGEQAEGGELIAQGTGAAAGGLVFGPLMAVVRGGGVVAESLRRIGQTTIRRPISTTAIETTAGASSGGGQLIAREAFPDSEVAEVLGAMAGGFALPALPATAFRLSGGRLATKVARSQFAGFTERGRRQQASDRLRDLAGTDQPDIESRLRSPDTLPQAGLSPAQTSGSRRLLSLERAVLDTNQTLDDSFRDRFSRANRVVRQEIVGVGKGGSPEATRAFIAKRRDYLVGLIGERVKRAHALAAQKLQGLAPGTSRGDANQIVRNELEGALSATVATEREIWDALPLELRVGTANANEALLKSFHELAKGETLADLPSELRRFIQVGKGGKPKLLLTPVEQARTLHKARSRALEDMRIAKANGRRNEARILDRFQESILADLGALEGRVAGELGESYRSALNFSRQLNEKFRRGTVGRLLGFSRHGGSAVPAEMTLERSIAGGGPSAGVAADEILRAVDQAPDVARIGMEDLTRSMFASQAVDPSGRFNSAAAQRFLGRNEALLNRFPALRREIEDTVQAGRMSDDLKARGDALVKSLHDKRVSRAALFLDAPVDQEIKAVLKDPNPRMAARDLRRMAARDKSGEATKGLQAAASEFIMQGAGTGKFDAEGVELLSGSAIRRNVLKEPRVKAVIGEILTPEQNANLDRIITTLERMEASQARTPDIGGIVDPATVPILDFMVRTIGARAGAQLGSGTTGASLLTSHFGAKRAQIILNAQMDRLARKGPRQLLVDAVQDRQLMLALLTKPDGVEKQRFIAQRLNAWLIGLGDERVNAILADDEGGPAISSLRPFNPGERRPNPDGSFSTELSITVKLPSGEFVNIPSLWMGPQGPVELGAARAVEAARLYEARTGKRAPRFKTVEEAERVAIQRSKAGGASKIPLFTKE